jgi:Predicted metal-binding integral membrane protein (DUF2182)
VAMSAGRRTMDNSSGAVGALMSVTGGVGGVGVGRAGISPLTAMRTELGIVAALLAAAGLAWWSTADRMSGMDAGPGTALGSPGWFTGVWATMMAAMMLPSLAPKAAVFAATVRRELSRILLFAAGYLLLWSAAGIGACPRVRRDARDEGDELAGSHRNVDDKRRDHNTNQGDTRMKDESDVARHTGGTCGSRPGHLAV